MSSFGGYSQGAVPSVRVPIKVGGVLLSGTEINSATETNTDAVAPKGAKRIGLFIRLAAEDSSAGTLDVDIEQNPAKTTAATWVDMPDGPNSETKAALAQFTAVGNKYVWHEHCGDAEFTRVRAELTQASLTASEGFTFGQCYWIFADVD